jgi:hypothetical protein
MSSNGFRAKMLMFTALPIAWALLASRSWAADLVTSQSETEGKITVTVEVAAELKAAKRLGKAKSRKDGAARWWRRGFDYRSVRAWRRGWGWKRWPAPLLQLSNYPLLTVEIDPAEPKNFVVTINETKYEVGARLFRVVPGLVKILVSRPGKDPCRAELHISEDETMQCRF